MANEGLGDDRAPRILGDVTNIFGKRPLALDLKISTNENKVERHEASPPKRQKGTGYETRHYPKSECAIEETENLGGSAKGTCHSTASDVRDHLNKENTRTAGHPPSLCLHYTDSDPDACGNVGAKMSKHDREPLHAEMPELDERGEEGCEADREEASRNALQTDGGCLNSISEMEDKVGVGSEECLTQDPAGKSGLLELFEASGSSGYKMNDTKELLNLHCEQNSEDAEGKGSVYLDKACMCSFCLKAAYMLADLHCQDTSSRLSAVNRTRKHIRLLEGKNYGLAHTGKTPRDIPKQSAEMELELMQQWRSLFLHTENVLVRETTQLHSTLLRLKELKENCKRDLEISTVSLDD